MYCGKWTIVSTDFEPDVNTRVWLVVFGLRRQPFKSKTQVLTSGSKFVETIVNFPQYKELNYVSVSILNSEKTFFGTTKLL